MVSTSFDLLASGDIDALLTFHKAQFGDARMEGDENANDDGADGADANADGEDDKPLGENGEKALKAERARAKKLEAEHKAAMAELKKFQDASKSEQEKAADRAAGAEKRAEEAEQKLMRLEVAAAKGLSPAQAKRLVGSTVEELEADADELIESFGSTGNPAPQRKPKEKQIGNVPDAADSDEDPEEIAAKIIKSRRGGL
jgi:hypothetical protein